MQTYEILALRYATVKRSEADVFLGGDPHERGLNMDYFIWLIRSVDRSIVVDTGFTRQSAEERGRQFLRCPGDALRDVGVDAGQVRDVIVTHLHYDHAGNLDLFPKAQFHLQEDEMQFATGRQMTFTQFREAYDVDDVKTMVGYVYNERASFYAGDAEFAPGIELYRVGGHTRGLQMVRVHTARGWVVLTSDAAHFYSNLEQDRLFPIVADPADMLEGYRRIIELADGAENIVAGHDPEVMIRFPAVSDELTGMAVRIA